MMISLAVLCSLKFNGHVWRLRWLRSIDPFRTVVNETESILKCTCNQTILLLPPKIKEIKTSSIFVAENVKSCLLKSKQLKPVAFSWLKVLMLMEEVKYNSWELEISQVGIQIPLCCLVTMWYCQFPRLQNGKPNHSFFCVWRFYKKGYAQNLQSSLILFKTLCYCICDTFVDYLR